MNRAVSPVWDSQHARAALEQLGGDNSNLAVSSHGPEVCFACLLHQCIAPLLIPALLVVRSSAHVEVYGLPATS
jgi:hypothetical protein